jgi:hypothetical protein
LQQLVLKGRAIGADLEAAAKDKEHEISTEVGRTSAGNPDGDVVDFMASRPDVMGPERTAARPSVPFSDWAAPNTLDEEPQARTVHGAVHSFEAGHAPYGDSDQTGFPEVVMGERPSADGWHSTPRTANNVDTPALPAKQEGGLSRDSQGAPTRRRHRMVSLAGTSYSSRPAKLKV